MWDCIACSLPEAFPVDDRSTGSAASTLKEERDSLFMQLQEAKREIEMLRTEKNLRCLQIEKLKTERQEVQNTLEAEQFLDRFFDW